MNTMYEVDDDIWSTKKSVFDYNEFRAWDTMMYDDLISKQKVDYSTYPIEILQDFFPNE